MLKKRVEKVKIPKEKILPELSKGLKLEIENALRMLPTNIVPGEVEWTVEGITFWLDEDDKKDDGMEKESGGGSHDPAVGTDREHGEGEG